MSWKKNALSYIWWFVYAVLAGTALLCLTGYVSGAMGLSIYWGILFAVLYALCAAVVVIIVHRISIETAAFFAGKRVLDGLIKAILLAIFSTIGLYLRLRLIDGLGTISDSLAMLIMTELIAQIAVAFLLFFALKRLVGYFCGLVSFGFVMCSPFVVNRLGQESPEMPFVFICLVVLLLITIGHRKRLHPLLFVFYGALSAFVTYMDLTGVVIFALALALVFVSREYGAGAVRKIIALFCCVMGFGAGFCGCAFIQSVLGKVSFTEMLEKWFFRYTPETFQVPVTVGSSVIGGEVYVLVGLMVLGIFSFWYDRNEERLSVGLFLLCGLIALSCFGMVRDAIPGTLGIYLLMTALAGVGVQQCMCGVCVSPVLLVPDGEEEGNVYGSAEPYDFLLGETERDVTEQSMPEQNEVTRDMGAMEVFEESQEEQEPEKPAIQFIENPLPLPKKHEKRVLDYDMEIADDDDFDI